MKLNETSFDASETSLKEAYKHSHRDIVRAVQAKHFNPGTNYDDVAWEELGDLHPHLAHRKYWKQHQHLASFYGEDRSKADMEYVHNYTSGNAGSMNRMLVGRNLASAKYFKTNQYKLHKGIMNLYDKAPVLDHDVHVYSGVGYNPTHLVKDGVFKTAAHTSTSLNPAIALDFAHGARRYAIRDKTIYYSKYHMIHFTLPKGFRKGIYVGDDGSENWTHQHEFILKPNTKWKITGSDEIPGIKENSKRRGRDPIVIWHAEPHVENLKETFEHDPETFAREPTQIGNPINRELRQDAFKQHQALANEAHDSWRSASSHTQTIQTVTGYKAYSAGVNNLLVDLHNKGIKNYSSYDFDRAKKLSEIIDKHGVALPWDMHVYSGTKRWKPTNDIKNGLIHTPAFTSTSLHPHVARSFAITSSDHGDVLHFHLPAGYKKGLYLEHNQKELNDPTEFEYVLQKGQTWKHTTTEHVDTGHYDANFQPVRYHIHTLVPHEPLTETTYHDPNFFKAHDWGEPTSDIESQHQMMSSLHSGVSEEAKFHFHTHKGDSRSLNYALVGKVAYPLGGSTLETLKARTTLLSNHIKNHAVPLQHEMHVYSGTAGYDIHGMVAHNKGIFHTPAFTSTSLSPKVAKGFTADRGDHSYGLHILHFHLPRGYHRGVYIDSDNIAQTRTGGPRWSTLEKEYLLDKNQHWKVTGHEAVPIYKHPDLADMKIHVWTLKPHEPELKEDTKPVDVKHFNNDKAAILAKGSTDGYARIYDWEAMRGDHPEHEWEHPDVEKQHHELSNLHNETYLTDKQSKALNDYTTGGGRHVNRALIGVGDYNSEVKTKIKHLDTVIKNIPPLNQDVHVYSGLGIHPGKLAIRGVFRTPAFTSASINPHIAFDIAAAHFSSSKKDVTPEHHIMHFHLPKGYSKALYIGDKANQFYTHQREILLGRGTRWKITGHDLHHLEGDSKIDPGQKVKATLHIWHAAPYEENLKEATYHEPMVFRTLARTAGSFKRDSLSKQRNSFSASSVASIAAKRSDVFIDVKAQHDHLSKQHKHIEDTKRNDVHEYTEFSKRLNGHLREGSPAKWNPEYHRAIIDLSSHIKRHAVPLDHEAHVYAGMGDHDPSSQFRNGITHTPAFTSTSLNPDVSQATFTKHNDKHSHIMHFVLPKGYKKGLYIEHLTAHSGEFEYLLDKDQQWKLKSHEVHNHTWFNTIPKASRTRYKEGKYVRKVHIWTVEPHDGYDNGKVINHQPLDETTFHDKHFFSRVSYEDRRPDKEASTQAQEKYGKLTRDLESARNEDVHSHWESIKNHHPRDLNGDESIAIDRYINSDSHSWLANHTLLKSNSIIGTPLHDQYGKYVPHTIEHVTKAIAKATPLEHEGHFYSGMKHFNPSKHFKKGIISTPAFTSTSIDPEIAQNFSHISMHDRAMHVLHFKLPVGYNKGAYVGDISGLPHEREYLLDKGQKWKLVGKSSVNLVRKSKDIGISEGSHTKLHIWSVVPHEDSLAETYDYHKRFLMNNPNWYNGSLHKTTSIRGDKVRMVVNSINRYTKAQAEYQEKEHHPKNVRYTLPEKIAMKEYKGSQGRNMNRRLLGHNLTAVGHEAHDIEQYDSYIHHLSKAIAKTPGLKSEIHVYSGTKINPDIHFEGDIFKAPSFISTSYDPNVTKDFGAPNTINGRDRHYNIIHFHLPVGYSKGMPLNPNGRRSSEKEYLLDKGQTWKITKHEKVKGPYRNDITHIWTMVPHESSIKEAYEHDPNYNYETKRDISDLEWPNKDPKLAAQQFLGKHTEQHDHLSKLHAPEKGTVAVHSVHDYTLVSNEYNEPLMRRVMLPPEKQIHHENLLNYLDAAVPLDHDVHVYSGFGKHDPSRHIKDGKLYSPSYMSTSISPEIAAMHNSSKGGYEDTHILHIHLPKGYTGGRYVAPFSSFPHEGEFLLKPFQHYKVLGKTVKEDPEDSNFIHEWHVTPAK